MTNNHPITPPIELVRQLQDLGNLDAIEFAYQAGADQELEACRLWVSENCSIYDARDLSLARRPASTVSKQSALEILGEIDEQFRLPSPQFNILYHAIQQLPE
jgi:hypothetical protein